VTLLSTRHARALVALLALALAAAGAQVLRPRRVDPCANPETLRVTSMIPGSVAEGERMERRGKVVIQWSEGRLEGAGGSRAPTRFQIVRAFGSFLLYLSPLQLLEENVEASDVEMRTLETAAGPIDVHLESARMKDQMAFVAYFYADGTEPVAHPFASKALGSFGEMLAGREPLSLFAVTGYALSLEEARRRAETWLGAAFEHFDAACRAPAARTAQAPAAS
jgi:hypothetical protein